MDIGLPDIKYGLEAVKSQLRGRSLPLDDSTLDDITKVVYEAIDAYEGFNRMLRR